MVKQSVWLYIVHDLQPYATNKPLLHAENRRAADPLERSAQRQDGITCFHEDRSHDANDIAYFLKKELDHHGFISIRRTNELIVRVNLHSILSDASTLTGQNVIPTIIDRASKLFCIVLLMGQHAHIHTFLEFGVNDDVFNDLKSNGPILSSHGLINFPALGREGSMNCVNISGKFRLRWKITSQNIFDPTARHIPSWKHR